MPIELDQRQPILLDVAIPRKLATQQIGRLGELLVQYELLRNGIESASLTTDAGVDLVAYSLIRGRSFTIQVKTTLAPAPAGGRGAPAINWWVSEDCPAEIYALADVSTRRVWLFTKQELEASAQQHAKGRFHLFMYTSPECATSAYARNGHERFSEFLFDNRVASLFQ